jgi:very-short-patch-repair endonuclease
MYRDADQRDFARRLRNQMTPAEKELWRFLRAAQLDGHKFRRQVAIGPYIVDFACLAMALLVELDGPQHGEAAAQDHDERRTAWLIKKGYRTIRFWNHELDENIHAVVDKIREALAEQQQRIPPPQPSPPGGGSRRNLK